METEARFEVPRWNQIYRMLLSQAEKIRKTVVKPDITATSRGDCLPGASFREGNSETCKSWLIQTTDGKVSERMLRRKIAEIH